MDQMVRMTGVGGVDQLEVVSCTPQVSAQPVQPRKRELPKHMVLIMSLSGAMPISCRRLQP